MKIQKNVILAPLKSLDILFIYDTELNFTSLLLTNHKKEDSFSRFFLSLSFSFNFYGTRSTFFRFVRRRGPFSKTVR